MHGRLESPALSSAAQLQPPSFLPPFFLQFSTTIACHPTLLVSAMTGEEERSGNPRPRTKMHWRTNANFTLQIRDEPTRTRIPVISDSATTNWESGGAALCLLVASDYFRSKSSDLGGFVVSYLWYRPTSTANISWPLVGPCACALLEKSEKV